MAAVPEPTMPPLMQWLTLLAVSGVVLFVLWLRQLRTKNATSVDAAWAALTGSMGIAFAILGQGAPLQRGLAAAIAAIWGGRLTWHLLRDRVFGHSGEDGRYAAMRAHFGDRAAVHFLWFYLLQALVAGVFALPFLLLAQNQAAELGLIQVLGLLALILGFAIETIADAQLARHRKDPTQRGRTCRSGLWRYSRHPNYFGEWLLWCGIAVIAFPSPHGFYALFAPALMYGLIRYVSGVPFAEKQALRSRGEDYRRYMATTNTFFPGPTRPEPNVR